MRRNGKVTNAATLNARRKLQTLLILGLAALVWPSALAAQVLNFKHYTSAEGLPQTQVLAIQQDRLGYLWFATYGGLSRFDGSSFKTYEKEHGLSSNSIFDIIEDARGRLLIATSGGLCIMTGPRFDCHRKSDGLISDNARSIAVDSAGGVWVGTAHGLSYLVDGTITNFRTTEGLPAPRVQMVKVDSGGRVWAATQKGLGRLHGNRFVLDSPDIIGDSAVQFIARAGDGILIGSQGRLFMRRGDAITPIAVGGIAPGTRLVDGALARDGTIWVATRTGVLRIAGGKVEQIGRAQGLLTDLVNCVSIDHEGNVWFGTDRGATKHVPGPFRTYTEGEGLPSTFVRAVGVDDKGRLWLGGRNGVAVREGERFTPIPLPGVPENSVYGLARRPGGGMLIGTRRGLVSWVDGKVKAAATIDGLAADGVFSFAEDGRGGVWIGTERGLGRWENDKVKKVTRPELSNFSVISMHRDRRGRLWMGRMEGGIVILDGEKVSSLGASDGATDQTVWAFEEDSKGAIWAATNGDGALRIDDKGIRRYTVKDGLASNYIWQVLADRRGDIWLFGNLGLNRFSGDRLSHYGRGSGLMELEGSAGASFEDTEGNLWFGTGYGIMRYIPGLDIAPDVVPPVFIEEASDDGVLLPAVAMGNTAKIRRGAVSIRFSAPSFRDESRIRFRYRLVGSRDAWSAPTAERSITYAGLSPGRYRFEVRSENGTLRSAAPATFAFEVLPAVWQTWWFRSICVALLLGAAAAVPALRARGLEQERQRLEALVARHTRELAEKNVRLESSNRDLEHFAYIASHDLQEPLRKIQAFSDRVTKLYAPQLDDQGRDYLSRMSGAAARMQRLIDALLSLSRVTTKKNPMEPIELPSLVQEVLGDLEIRIQSTGGRVEVGELPNIDGDPVQIRQVFQNLIGNALKFHRPEEAPVVRVTAVLRDEHTIEIRIEDNGIGFENKDAERVFLPFQRLHARAQYEGTGIGLTICQKIVDRHGGTIRAESTPGKGSRFVLTLPVGGPMGERHAA